MFYNNLCLVVGSGLILPALLIPLILILDSHSHLPSKHPQSLLLDLLFSHYYGCQSVKQKVLCRILMCGCINPLLIQRSNPFMQKITINIMCHICESLKYKRLSYYQFIQKSVSTSGILKFYQLCLFVWVNMPQFGQFALIHTMFCPYIIPLTGF